MLELLGNPLRMAMLQFAIPLLILVIGIATAAGLYLIEPWLAQSIIVFLLIAFFECVAFILYSIVCFLMSRDARRCALLWAAVIYSVAFWVLLGVGTGH